MNVKEVHFVTRAAVTAVYFLIDWLWRMGRREWMWKGEEDDVLRQSTVTGSMTCLSLWRCLCHLVKWGVLYWLIMEFQSAGCYNYLLGIFAPQNRI